MHLKVVLIGRVKLSQLTLNTLSKHASLLGVITSTFGEENSDYVDLEPDCQVMNIPLLKVDDINTQKVKSWLVEKDPDVIFCIGWSQVIGLGVLSVPKIGVVGYHPSLLPRNRGKHPLVWALVLGLSATGSTFFLMDEGVDTGKILSQKTVLVESSDDASSLYKKICETALVQLQDMLTDFEAVVAVSKSQNLSEGNYWRKRSEDDGVIDWRMHAKSIHNLIRGLTHPYCGAKFCYNGKTFLVWRSEILELAEQDNIEPGRVIKVDSTGVVVKCGIGYVRLLDVQPNLEVSKGMTL